MKFIMKKLMKQVNCIADLCMARADVSFPKVMNYAEVFGNR